MLELRSMESFPPGNPFHHDAISVGASLSEIGLPHVYIMDSGTFGPGLYIVNGATGERVKVTGVSGQ